jgi:hypothetical protein
MQTVILILRAIDKQRSFVIKRHPSVPTSQLLLLTLILDLLLLEISHQLFIVFFADVTKQEVIERFYVGVGTISNDVHCGLWSEKMLDRYV